MKFTYGEISSLTQPAHDPSGDSALFLYLKIKSGQPYQLSTCVTPEGFKPPTFRTGI